MMLDTRRSTRGRSSPPRPAQEAPSSLPEGLLDTWHVTTTEAIRIQAELRERVIDRGTVRRLRYVAGADAAFSDETVYAGVVVLTFPELHAVETVVVTDAVSFPYIPGLLSFRESPALLKAFARLQHSPDLVLIDGHGRSHPCAAGIAYHIGVVLERPVIGCAKSLLVGTYEEPGICRGSVVPLCDRSDSIIGAAVRTRDRVKPVFVSGGIAWASRKPFA